MILRIEFGLICEKSQERRQNTKREGFLKAWFKSLWVSKCHISLQLSNCGHAQKKSSPKRQSSGWYGTSLWRNFRHWRHKAILFPKENSANWQLCFWWQKTDIYTQKHLIELLVLEPFLIILPKYSKPRMIFQHKGNAGRWFRWVI